jgi:Ca2+-binding EF-hand superfamily protein
MEISAFLDKKLARRFRTYDLDGDGYIEREDFELAAKRTGAEFGLSPDAPARQRLTHLLLELWQHLAAVADADADGGIGEAEYKAAFAAGMLETPDSFDQGYLPFLEALMDVVDTDGDGKLTADDHIRWSRALMKAPEDVARETHRRADTDGDGYITTRELLELIREFYFDEDPNSAGSWALGPLEPAPTPR